MIWCPIHIAVSNDTFQTLLHFDMKPFNVIIKYKTMKLELTVIE